MKNHVEEYTISEMCKAMEVSMSGYYFWLKNPVTQRKKRDAELSKKIILIHQASHKRYGSPRIHKALEKQNEKVGRKRVIRLMQENNIVGKAKRKFKATTDSNHDFRIAPNLLNQKFNVSIPNQVWVGDITYIPTNEGWLYLAVVIDLFSRKIVGWAMDKRMTSELVVNALMMAYWKRKPKAGIIFHSDRGSQYASNAFQECLKKYGFRSSMSGKGNCFDNAVAETFFHSLKVELVHDVKFETRVQGKSEIFNYIEIFYNRNRLHSTLNYCTPFEFEQKYEERKVA